MNAIPGSIEEVVLKIFAMKDGGVSIVYRMGIVRHILVALDINRIEVCHCQVPNVHFKRDVFLDYYGFSKMSLGQNDMMPSQVPR